MLRQWRIVVSFAVALVGLLSRPAVGQVGGGVHPNFCDPSDPSCSSLYSVTVYPNNSSEPARLPSGTGFQVVFTVVNQGSRSQSYALTCAVVTPVSNCSLNKTTTGTLAASGGSTTVTATYGTAATTGVGQLTITASNSNTSGSGSVSVTVGTVRVTPDARETVARTANTSGLVDTFTVTNPSAIALTYNIYCGGGGTVVACNYTSVSSLTLSAGQSAQVTANYNVAGPGAGTVTLSAQVGSSGVADYGSYQVQANGFSSLDGLKWDNQDMGRCAQSCFYTTLAQSTVPYFSLGTARNVTLAFHQARTEQRPFIHVNVQAPSGVTPDEYWLEAKINGSTVTFVNGDTKLRYQGITGPGRLGGQLSTASYANGVYPLTITVSIKAGATVTQETIATHLVIADELAAAVARGWRIAGIEHLDLTTPNYAILTDGTGSVKVFGYGCSQTHCYYTSPRGDFSRLDVNPTGGYVRAAADSSKIFYDATGRMTQTVDRVGNSTTIGYNGTTQQVATITDPMGRVITLGYNANGLATITDPTSRVTNVTVQSNRTLTAVQDPDGISTVYGYDSNLNPGTITDRAGAVTTLSYLYPSSHLLGSVTSPSVTVLTAGSPPSSGTASPTTSFTPWQADNVPFSSTASTLFPWVAIGDVVAIVTEPGGASHYMVPDRFGQAQSVSDALSNYTNTTYDLDGLPRSSNTNSRDAGARDTIAYNLSGQPTYTKLPNTDATALTYGAYGQVISTTGVGQPTTRITLSSLGLPIKSELLKTGTTYQQTSRATYDSRGRVDSTFDGKDQLQAHRTYESVGGNLAYSGAVSDRATNIYYDNAGRDTLRVPSIGPRIRKYYSVVNRVDSVTVRGGALVTTTRYTYNNLYLTGVRDAKGQLYQYGYNAIGWKTSETDPVGRTQTFGYSVDGDLIQWTNRRGQAVNYSYNAIHQPLTKGGVGTDSVSWAYANGGGSIRFAAARTSLAADSVYLNVRGQADSVRTVLNGVGYWQRFHYTTAGLQDSAWTTGGTGNTWLGRKYGYGNPAFALDTIRLGGTATTSYTLDNNFQPTATTLPGGESDSVTYGTTRFPVAYANSSAYYGTLVRRLLGFTGDYIAAHMKSETNGRFFVYDSLGRLAQAADSMGPGGSGCSTNQIHGCITHGNGWMVVNGSQAAFTYDSVGNRTDQGGAYTSGNRITTFGQCTYATDYDGNVTARTCSGTGAPPSATFSWDPEGRLASYTTGGVTQQFRYDATGRLVQRYSSLPRQHFLWQGSNLLAELDSTATAKLSEYSYAGGPDQLHAEQIGGTLYYGHHDGIGNTIALTNQAQQVIRQYSYTDWGLGTGGTGTDLGGRDRSGFKGALRIGSDLDLYYMRARWYEPYAGRFLNEDPSGMRGGINPYAFADSDPIDAADPTGRSKCFIVLANGDLPDGGVGVLGYEVRVCEDDSGGDGNAPDGGDAPPAIGPRADGSVPSGGGPSTQSLSVAKPPTRPNSCGNNNSSILENAFQTGVTSAVFGAASGAAYGYNGGSLFGAVAGAAFGVESGPGALITATVGSRIGGGTGFVVGGLAGAFWGFARGAYLGALGSTLYYAGKCALTGT